MAVVFTDLFTSPPNSPLYERSGWSEAGNITYRTGMQVADNTLTITQGAASGLDYTCYAEALNNDHWSGVVLGNDPDGLGNFWYGRADFSKDATRPDFLRMHRTNSDNDLRAAVLINNGGTYTTTLFTMTSATSDPGGFPIVDGDYIEYRCVGDVIDFYKNGNRDGTGGIHLNASLPIDISSTGLAASDRAGFNINSNTSYEAFYIGNFGPAIPTGWSLQAPNNLLDADGNAIVGPITVDKAVFRSTFDSNDPAIFIVESGDANPVIIESGGTISYEESNLGPAGTTFDVELTWGDNYALIQGQTVVENP